jgi:hypothetical protein
MLPDDRPDNRSPGKKVDPQNGRDLGEQDVPDGVSQRLRSARAENSMKTIVPQFFAERVTIAWADFVRLV